jgi:nucleotide-binding universal stress UspA family protein
MNASRPQHIICAVRGKPESRETVTRAIDLAVESGAKLTFFYAIDAEFQAQAAIGSPLSVVYRELLEMARFTMLILCDRALRRGVAHVDYVLREGNVRSQLRKFVTETQAELLVMGMPAQGPGRPAFRSAELEAFGTQLEREGNLRVVQVMPSEPR